MLSVKNSWSRLFKMPLARKKVRELAEKNNIQAEITKVEDINEMMSYGIMMTPGLVINEQVKSYGIIPKDEQILKWLKEGA